MECMQAVAFFAYLVSVVNYDRKMIVKLTPVANIIKLLWP
jgi:hypothetical protein